MRLFSVLVILFFSVQTFAQKGYVNVVNINNAPLLAEDAIIYGLPQNKIKIRVTAVKKIVKAGQFHQYAAKYLGEANVNRKDKVAWEISNIDIQTVALPDTGHIYAIDARGDNLANFVSLTDEGFLQAINYAPSREEVKQRIQPEAQNVNEQQNRTISYSHLSTRKTLVEKVDTVYKSIQQDSMVVRVPIVRRQLVQKTPEQKAREIAELLFTLRDDKNALLIGEGDGQALPDGQALRVMLDEMNKLEQDYMALFIGTSWQEVYEYEYEFQPNAQRSSERKVLFKLSKTHGILPAEDRHGSPILFSLKKDDTQNSIRYFLDKQVRFRKKPFEENGLVYRIPGVAEIVLQNNKEVIFKQKTKIAQFGYTNRLPVSLLKKKDYVVQFNSLFGSLISIQSVQSSQ